jgi:hypothetical protein
MSKNSSPVMKNYRFSITVQNNFQLLTSGISLQCLYVYLVIMPAQKLTGVYNVYSPTKIVLSGYTKTLSASKQCYRANTHAAHA